MPNGLLSSFVRSTVPKESPFGLQVAEVTFWERVVFNIVGAASSQAWRARGRAEVGHESRAEIRGPGRVGALSARIKIAIRGSTRGRAPLATRAPRGGFRDSPRGEHDPVARGVCHVHLV